MKKENVLESKKLSPKEHIKEIIKLPSQDFLTVEYESGERKFYERKK
jgi:hypothetical protein